MTTEELNELKRMCAKGFQMMDANQWKYFYKLVLGKNPPNCGCSYGQMTIELRQWLVDTKN